MLNIWQWGRRKGGGGRGVLPASAFLTWAATLPALADPTPAAPHISTGHRDVPPMTKPPGWWVFPSTPQALRETAGLGAVLA